jgi:hypothetical protein
MAFRTVAPNIKAMITKVKESKKVNGNKSETYM